MANKPQHHTRLIFKLLAAVIISLAIYQMIQSRRASVYRASVSTRYKNINFIGNLIRKYKTANNDQLPVTLGDLVPTFTTESNLIALFPGIVAGEGISSERLELQNAFEYLGNEGLGINIIAFDKTGLATKGVPGDHVVIVLTSNLTARTMPAEEFIKAMASKDTPP